MNNPVFDIKTEIKAYLEGESVPDTCKQIHKRSNNRGELLRVSVNDERTVIVKLWYMNDTKKKIKSVLGVSNSAREWRMHRYIFLNEIPVAEPLHYLKLHLSNGDRWECMIFEDLGPTRSGLSYLKTLIALKDEEGIEIFEKSLIGITEKMLMAGIIDIDHQLNNFLVNDKNELFRNDFECAKHSSSYGRRVSNDCPEMLARLIASHVYAVQPDVKRTENFVEKLYTVIEVNRKMRIQISERVNKKLEVQFQKNGINSIVCLMN